MTDPVLEIENLSLSIGDHPILKDIDLTVRAGEVLGLVGESGSGKSMTAQSVMRLLPHAARTAGSIRFAGEEILAASEGRMCELRGDDIGMVFQEPMTALNPVKTIGEQVAEGIRFHRGLDRAEALDRASQMLDRVGLPESRFPLTRYPHELSGGQRQRIGIARALSLSPKLIVLDEPVSALDVSIQAGVLNLLEELQGEVGCAYLFIAHDLGVVRHISRRVAVMYLGRIVEMSPVDTLFRAPQHPYTQSLISAIPRPDPRTERTRKRIVLSGDLPSPINPPPGCRFHTRCPKATAICRSEAPALAAAETGGGVVACHHPGPISG